MSKYIPPAPPTLEDTIAAYGGVEKYLNAPEIMAQNNNFNAHDIFLLLDVSYAAAASKTGRDVRTVKRWQEIKAKERQGVK